MTFNLNSFSKKLRRYREQFESSPDDVSSSTGISIQSLSALENAERRPTGDEILIFADYYKCDYNFFLSDEDLTPFEQSQTLYRRYGTEFSKEDRWVIQEFLFLCESEDFLLKSLSREASKSFKFTKTGTHFKSHGIQAASKLREHLGYSSIQVSRDIYHDFRSIGFHIFRRQLVNSNISGLCIKHPTAGNCILINYSEDIYRTHLTF